MCLRGEGGQQGFKMGQTHPSTLEIPKKYYLYRTIDASPPYFATPSFCLPLDNYLSSRAVMLAPVSLKV